MFSQLITLFSAAKIEMIESVRDSVRNKDEIISTRPLKTENVTVLD